MSNRAAGVLLAALVGLCMILGWRIWVLTRNDVAAAPDQRTVTTEPDASQAFLTAWEGNEKGTYLTIATVGLTGNGVGAFTEDVVARRNGKMIINRDSTIIFERAGETETCRQTAGELFCTQAESIGSVQDRRAQIEDLLAGDDARYRVGYAAEPGCFEITLDLSKGSITPEFGLESEYCYDGATAGLSSRTVERVNRTETYRTDGLSGAFTRADLEGLFPSPILDRFFE